MTSRMQKMVHDSLALTSANNVRQVRLYSLMRNVAVSQCEHLAVHERHRFVVTHQHATLTPGPIHVPGAPPRATGVAPEPLGLGRYDKVALRRVIDLSFLHELRQRVINELPAGPLHGRERVPQGRSQGVQGRRLPLGGQLQDGPAQGLRQRRELALGDRSYQTVLYIACEEIREPQG